MIRIAEKRDLPAIGEIYNYQILNGTATFDTVVKDEEYFTELFNSHSGRYRLLVYEENGVVAGYASLSVYNKRGAFNGTSEISVYVGEGYRGRGIGKALVKEILRQAEEEKLFKVIISQITSKNAISKKLHEDMGFVFCGSLKGVGEKFSESLDLDLYEYFIGE